MTRGLETWLRQKFGLRVDVFAVSLGVWLYSGIWNTAVLDLRAGTGA